MMVYRIAKKNYINDLSGEGARLYGGRWNRKGTALLYTSENRSLATVEYLVHIPMTLLPKDLCIASIEIPKDSPSFSLEQKDLPAHWMTYPPPIKLYEVIENLVRDNKFLSIRVPSAVVEGEYNILINPRHSGCKDVHICEVREYRFDDRLRSLSQPNR